MKVLVELEVTPSPSFGPAVLPQIPGLDTSFSPVPFHSPRGVAMGGPAAPTVVVRADIPSIEDVDDLTQLPHVHGVWSDPKIEAFPITLNPPVVTSPLHPHTVACNSTVATGNGEDVAHALGAPYVWERGFSGQNVVVGVLDGGIDGSIYPVDGGWSPDPNHPPGDSQVVWGGHGNMCAFDALVAAPDARLLDYSIGRAMGGVSATLGAALQAFQHAITSYRLNGTPQVLSNSWGLYRDSWDQFPPGHPSNYTHNPNHPFTRKVVEAMDLGMLVTFAAGNCGDGCSPAGGRCGPDVGPGKSIRGANGHPRVICVGAVDVQRNWVGYSSQGPSTLDPHKPDLCGYTHFEGHTQCDNGTSAACPVVAGVLALLRSAFPELRQERARETLCDSAVNIGPVGWDRDSGHGVVVASAAYESLHRFMSPPRP